MNIITPPLSWYVDRLTNCQPFTLSRYGDGEWQSILGYTGGSTVADFYAYTPELRAALQATLARPHLDANYHYALAEQSFIGTKAGEIEGYLAGTVQVKWHESQTMQEAFRYGAAFPLINALRGLDMIYVGPAPLLSLSKHLGFRRFVPVPQTNAFEQVGRIWTDTHELIIDKKPDVIGFSAGAAANVLIWRLWCEEVTLIDFGSMFDPIVGNLSRSWMKRVDWAQIMPMNLRGE